jgi:hypothetical protein
MRRHLNALRPAVYGVSCYARVLTYYVYHTLRLIQGNSESEDLTAKYAKSAKEEKEIELSLAKTLSTPSSERRIF